MKHRFLRRKWLLTIAAVVVLLAASLFLLTQKFEYEREKDQVLEYFSKQEGMRESFAALEQLTPPGTVVLCWWDYGRAVQVWSHREVIEAHPSRDIWYTMGSSRTFLGNLRAQLFGTWGSSKKIHDLADIFMLPEHQALPIVRTYNATYTLVFKPDDLQKFPWIAEIGGYNATAYLTYDEETDTYEPTTLGSQSTLLRLLFDESLHLQYFTKLFDNGKGKIFRVDYP